MDWHEMRAARLESGALLPHCYHYYHLFLPSGNELRGLQIFEEHAHHLRASWLIGLFRRIIVIVVSDWEEAFSEVKMILPEAYIYLHRKGFEMLTLYRLQLEIANMSDNTLVLYAHSKGASYIRLHGAKNLMADDWRRMMTHFCATRWREAVAPLVCGRADVSGAFYLTPHRWQAYCEHQGMAFGEFPYFAGNFWWATVRHLKRLPKVDCLADRFFAERWVCLVDHKASSAFQDVWPSQEVFERIKVTAELPKSS